jgi:excisionase family DNA binding protein
MLAILVALIVSVAIFVILLLAIVVVGIRQEPPTEELSERASCLIAALVRRLLGLHVRKPGSPPNLVQSDEGPCLARMTPPADTVEQVAEMLHVGRDKVYYLLRTGQLRSIKIGKLRRITEQHLAAFIASREDVADAS